MNSTTPDTSTSTWPDLKDTLVSGSSHYPPTSGTSSSIRPQWRDPEASIGLPCCSLGLLKCWEVIGLALHASKPLLRGVKDFLDQHADYLHNNISTPFSITFGLFMIGRTEQNSSPTLVISCESELARDRCINLCRRSSMLIHYPGVLLASSSHSPTTLGRVQSQDALTAADNDFVFFTPPSTDNVCGRAIHVMERSVPRTLCPTSISQKATIGGFVRLRTSEHDGLYCGLTVAHAFEDDFSFPLPSPWMGFSFDGEEPILEKDALGDVLMGEGEASESSLARHSSQLCGMINAPYGDRTYSDSVKHMEGQGIGSRLTSSLNGQHPDLDWALVEIQQPYHEPANVMSVEWIAGGTQMCVKHFVSAIKETANVLVVTSTGTQTGFLSSSSMFYKSPHAVSSEEVYVVRLDGKFKRGDAGAWVIDPESGDLYGHLIAGCPDSNVAYLIPAHRIFSDIREQLGGTVELAGMAPTAQRRDESSTQLGMIQTDEEIMKQLQMSRAIFAEMAVETEVIYQALITNPSNLKKYIKKQSPYSWNDISDKSKYEAMIRLSSSTNPRTQPFWYQGRAAQGRENILARWFLFRRFRLVGMGQQKRYGGAHPEDLDMMFVPRPASRMRNRPVNMAGTSGSGHLLDG
ncbi:uncharacterized protein PAC_16570 [Phialocephala subalpina]|uniref:Uncharacterized protein n=1 Tax=Phialocephala subalpina TaxID=576137 RepID=A0A1L7XNR0_9HELO|nr:uncharacterized protein PAC_16570 [Phialocephala subalpina]